VNCLGGGMERLDI